MVMKRHEKIFITKKNSEDMSWFGFGSSTPSSPAAGQSGNSGSGSSGGSQESLTSPVYDTGKNVDGTFVLFLCVVIHTTIRAVFRKLFFVNMVELNFISIVVNGPVSSSPITMVLILCNHCRIIIMDQ